MKKLPTANHVKASGNFNAINKASTRTQHFEIDIKRNPNYHDKVDKHCFSYIRFSSVKQAAGNSLDRQLEIAPRVAKEKGWTLRDDLRTENLAVSAHKGLNLETFRDIIDKVKTGKIATGTVMIIEAWDRFSRADIDIAEDVMKDMLRAGLEIYVDRGGHHLTKESINKPLDRIIALLELAAANEYSERLSDRTGKAWRKKKALAADKVVMTRMAPAWLDVDKKNNEIKQNDKAGIVQGIFIDYANGIGIRTIMRELNAKKVPPFGKGKQNKHGCWSNTHIRRILQSRQVLGEYQPHTYSVDDNGKRTRQETGEPVKDYYPEIIEPALFYKVQQKLANHGHSPSRKGKITNLFTGIAKCPCGAAMHLVQKPAQGGKYYYESLICANVLRGKQCGYGYHSLQVKYVERAVLSLLFSKVVPAMTEKDSKKEKLITLTGELKEAQKQLAKWTSIINQSDVVPATAAQHLNLYETRQSALKRQIEALSAMMNDNPLTSWQQVENTPQNRLKLQTILKDEIESLTIDAGKMQATLVIKEPHCTFNISWPSAEGTNKTKANPANSHFFCAGVEQPFEYLDNILVWKSEQNMKLDELVNHITISPEMTKALNAQ